MSHFNSPSSSNQYRSSRNRSNSGSSTPTNNPNVSHSNNNLNYDSFHNTNPTYVNRSGNYSNGYTFSSTSTPTSSQSFLYNQQQVSEPKSNMSYELHEKIFQDKSKRILSYLSSTQNLVEQLKVLNRSKWAFRYPSHPTSLATTPSSSTYGLNLSNLEPMNEMSNSYNQTPTMRNRSNSFDMSLENSTTGTPTKLLRRSQTMLPETTTNDLDILRLDVKVGNQFNERVVASLEGNSISNLFEDRLSHCLSYLDKLITRVADKNSKILVTGDLNSGKSTFINALLKRRVLPTDQQPCTMLFCEVLPIEMNDHIEEAHAIPNSLLYDRTDDTTFDRVELRHLPRTVSEQFHQYELVKVYCTDRAHTESMLSNDTLDITLIDSPGLNRDSLKTTQLFARQEEIDVVVFVVHAENQFTLSGQEFLQSAGKEKAYIFIVVNRFDTIRNKKKCKSLVLDQISQLSPRTYDDADELVHFVAAEDCFPEDDDDDEDSPDALPNDQIPEDFHRLEGSLRTFLLEKRARSKLAPAKRFALNVLNDITTLSNYNLDAIEVENNAITSTLNRILPQYEATVKAQDSSIKTCTEVSKRTVKYARTEIERSLDAFIHTLDQHISLPSWYGIFGLGSYTFNLKLAIGASLRKCVSDCESRVLDSAEAAYQTILKLDSELETQSVPPCSLTLTKNCKEIDELLEKVNLTYYQVLDVPNKLKYLSSTLSLLTLGGSQLIGTKTFFFTLYQVFVQPADYSKWWILAGVSLTGLAIASVTVTDLQQRSTQLVLTKTQELLKERKCAYNLGEKSSAGVERYLEKGTSRLVQVYKLRIQNQQNDKKQNLELQKVVLKAKHQFEELMHKAVVLKDKLKAVETE